VGIRIKLQHLVQHDDPSVAVIHLYIIWACEEITALLCITTARLVWKFQTVCSSALDFIFVHLVKRVE
jgi:hypothetical protein